MYPAIADLVLCYFSLLNLVAKALRRRSSDWLFGPTLLFFVVFHRSRSQLASVEWFVSDNRVSMAVSADELDAASLLDFFTTDLAYRTHRKVPVFFFTKCSRSISSSSDCSLEAPSIAPVASVDLASRRPWW